MTVITLTFLFQFPKPPEKLPKTPKSARSKKGKKAPPPDPEYLIRVQKPSICAHVEYELLPKAFKYSFDLVSWGKVAKVYSADDVIAFKTFIYENYIWVPVFVQHTIPNLSDEDIEKVLKHIIYFACQMGKKKLTKKATEDKVKAFYEKVDDMGFPFFEVFETDINAEDQEQKEEKEIAHDKNKIGDAKKYITTMHSKDLRHISKVVEVIERIALGKEVRNLEFIPFKGKKPKAPKGVKIEAYAEVFFSNPCGGLIRAKKTNKKLLEFLVFISTERMMERTQMWNLSPMIFNFLKISNLPANVLKENGYTHLKFQCEIPEILSFKSTMRPINNKVFFDISKIVMTNNVTVDRIVEIFSTKQVKLNVIGVKVPPKVKADKKGKKKKKKAKKQKKVKPVETVVATVGYNMAQYIQNHHRFIKEKAQLHNPNSLMFQNHGMPPLNFINKITINEFQNRIIESTMIPSPLSEALLLQEQSTFKIEVRFRTPYYSIHTTTPTVLTYKRMLLFVYHEKTARIILKKIYDINEKLCGLKIFFYHVSKLDDLILKKDEEVNEELLSGFVIENDNCCIIFVEGTSDGVIMSVLQLVVDQLNYDKAKVFYNDNISFSTRLYGALVPKGGFYHMIMREPMMKLMKKKEIYIERNMPFLCYRAIRKLMLIFKASIFQIILSNNLLLTIPELYNLSLEFGTEMVYNPYGPEDSHLSLSKCKREASYSI